MAEMIIMVEMFVMVEMVITVVMVVMVEMVIMLIMVIIVITIRSGQDPSKEFLAKVGNMDQPERRPRREGGSVWFKPQFYITTDKGLMTPSLTTKLQPRILPAS